MAGHLVGVAQQLAAILRRHFVAIGHPPQGAQWEIPCEASCNFAFAAPHRYGEVEPVEISKQGMKRLGDATRDNSFGSLLSDDSWLIRDAIKHISPIRETSAVMRDISSELDPQGSQSPRLAYLFSKLCEGTLFTRWGFCESVDCITEMVTYSYTLTLAVVGPNFLGDLDSAIAELTQSPAGRIPLANDDLTDAEETLLEALGDKIMAGPQLADESGFPNNSTFRTRLSNLVKRGILEKLADQGYRKIKY